LGTRQNLQQAGFASARRTDDGNLLTRAQLQVNGLQGCRRMTCCRWMPGVQARELDVHLREIG
jgi:hypothetical protein